ncbi:MAG: glycosyltransferase family 4 protein [Candidatus Berkelbacteria bacterium]|nr:glycosyltransferase family 4 protein [Candidatus Berkelbacteria bacterium]
MKVLLVMQFPLSGAGTGTFVSKLSEKLNELEDIEVVVAAPDIKGPKGVKFFPIKPPFKAVFVSHPQYPNAKRFSELSSKKITEYYLSYFRQLIEIVEEYKPDVIHIHHAFMLSWIANYIRSLYGIGYLVTSHGTCVYAASLDLRFKSLTSQALQKAVEVTAVSHHTKKWLCKVFGAKFRNKVKVITGGIDLEAYSRDQISYASIEKKYNLKGKDVVMFIGRLTKEKGVEYLIDAAKNIDAEIIVIGDGSHRKYLENYTRLKGAKNIRFLGYIKPDETRQFYKRANVVVVPSVWDEPLGLVILEAMAMETPVVASNKGGIPLAVKDGYNGFLVRPRSAKAISETVNRILKDEILARKLGQNARKFVEERFGWKKAIVPKFVALYKKVSQATNYMRDERLRVQFEREELEREKRELAEKIGHTWGR